MRMTRRTAIFLSAAVPVGYSALAYLILVVHVFVAAASGGDIGVAEHTGLWYIGAIAIALTLIQWPFYFLWVGLSGELNFGQKFAWWILIFFGNMFTMPYFLWCKYRRKTEVVDRIWTEF